jgi:hypothetical protein
MSGAVTKTNKHNTNKEDIPNSSHLPFIGTADTVTTSHNHCYNYVRDVSLHSYSNRLWAQTDAGDLAINLLNRIGLH